MHQKQMGAKYDWIAPWKQRLVLFLSHFWPSQWQAGDRYDPSLFVFKRCQICALGEGFWNEYRNIHIESSIISLFGIYEERGRALSTHAVNRWACLPSNMNFSGKHR